VIERAVLAADLQHAAAGLDSVGDFARFLDRVGHRLFEIDVLAVLERGHRVIEMPVIRRADHDDVDVLPRAELAIVVVDGLFVHARPLACQLFPLLPDVVDGERLDVPLLLRPPDDVVDVGAHAAAAADEAHVDPIVGADDAALRGRGRHR
jgi:hypothetical protein